MTLRTSGRWLGLLAGIATALLVGVVAQPAAAAVHRTYGYETGLQGWQMGYDGSGTWKMGRSTQEAYAGAYSVKCVVDGASGFGTAWMARGFAVPMDTLVDATVTVQLYSPTRSDVNQSAVVGYIGTAPPTSRADFQVIGYTGMVAGWYGYQLNTLQLTGQYPAQLWVAVGVSTTWEFTVQYYMDQVTVAITP